MTVIEQSLSLLSSATERPWLNESLAFEVFGSFSTQASNPIFKNFLKSTDAFALSLLSPSL